MALLLNAKRFEYSILRNIDPATAGEYAAITDEIKGAPEWRAGADALPKTATDDEKAAQGSREASQRSGCRRQCLHRLRPGRLH